MTLLGALFGVAAREGSCLKPMKSLTSPLLGGRTRIPSPSSLVLGALAGRGVGGTAPASSVSKDLLQPKDLPTVTTLEWKRPLEVVKYPDPRLRALNARVGVFDNTLLELAKEMMEVMYEDDGVGLAAPQVGVNIRLMVFNPEGRAGRGQGKETILVNPEVVSVSKTTAIETEGCLSFPKLYGNVERPRDIFVRAQNEKGEEVQLQLGGLNDEAAWLSRIFQHEYDHLQGILFHDRMKTKVLDSVRGTLLNFENAFIAANPEVKIQRVPPPKVKKGF